MKPDEIREIRELYTDNRSEWADKIGIPLRTVENWEYGTNVPAPSAVALLNVLRDKPNLAKQQFGLTRKK